LGETPDHVLFGVHQLARSGIETVFLPYPASGPWARFQRFLVQLRIPLELGDLQQQMLAIRLCKNADIVYAPCGTQTHLLQYLRAFGFFKLPIVTLLHHPFPKGKLDFLRIWQRQLFIRGADRLPCLSQELSDYLLAKGAPPHKIQTVTWGTDVSFYGPWEPPGQGVIASGRTGRDFKTFALAAVRSGLPATIVGLQGHLNDPVFQISSQLRVIEARNEEPVPGEDTGWLKYPTLCRYMRDHAVVAIPLFPQRSIAGLTSLMDSLGLGRAVLMTRNSLIDLDIEAEGVGFWLEPGDVEGWVDRLNWVQSNPEEVKAMGFRARQLAERTLNSESFSKQISTLLQDALLSSYRG
jgi:glycosyltransferase involved in cell wall biosynthesis